VVAIDRIYAEHGDWLRGWLQRQTRCPHWAADVTQDTFCRLLERPHSIAVRNPRGLLAVIARRLLVDDVRRRDLERAYLDAYRTMHGEFDPLTPERIIEAVQLLEGVVQLLRHMSDDIREAFLLRKLEGLTHSEIASRLHISDRTVKRHLARAYAHCYLLAYPDQPQ
jgi:RNA polymerase sigma-70 factor (ECF subfamily)